MKSETCLEYWKEKTFPRGKQVPSNSGVEVLPYINYI